MSILVRPAETRFVTRAEGRTTFHSFSYGTHYDPAHVSFGPLIALNDEQLPPGTGYEEHRHSGVVIVSWVLEGRLDHSDSLGNAELLEAGTIAVAETGAGISHAERADPEHGVRFLQFMLRPDGVSEPSYTTSRVDELTAVPTPLAGARMLAGLAQPGELELPASPAVDVFVVDGHVVIGDRELGPGDEARLTDQPHRALRVEEPSRLAIWAFD